MECEEKEEKQLTVDGDADLIAQLLQFGACQTEGAQVPQDQMVVRTTSLELVAVPNELLAKRTSVGDNLLRVRLESGRARLEKRSRNCCNGLYRKARVKSCKICQVWKRKVAYVVVGTTLAGGEDGLVDALLEVLGLGKVLAEEDETSARSTERLVST